MASWLASSFTADPTVSSLSDLQYVAASNLDVATFQVTCVHILLRCR